MVVDFDTELCDLVVTERRGNYCYIGPPYGPRLEPTWGIYWWAVTNSGVRSWNQHNTIIYRDGMFRSCLLIYH